MKTLQGLSSAPNQSFSYSLNEGRIDFTLRYKPRSQSWYLSLSFGGTTINGVRLVRSPNVLYQYQNIIPFGILVSVSDGFEPFLVTDFSDGRVQLNVLSHDEVEEVNQAFIDYREEDNGT